MLFWCVQNTQKREIENLKFLTQYQQTKNLRYYACVICTKQQQQIIRLWHTKAFQALSRFRIYVILCENVVCLRFFVNQIHTHNNINFVTRTFFTFFFANYCCCYCCCCYCWLCSKSRTITFWLLKWRLNDSFTEQFQVSQSLFFLHFYAVVVAVFIYYFLFDMVSHLNIFG